MYYAFFSVLRAGLLEVQAQTSSLFWHYVCGVANGMAKRMRSTKFRWLANIRKCH